MTELLIQEHEFFQETETDERQVEAFVFDWLHLPETAVGMTEKAQRLGLDVNKQRVAILIDCQDESFMKQDQYKQMKDKLQLTNQEIIVRWGHARFCSCYKPHQMVVIHGASACSIFMLRSQRCHH
ncbi:hypothetical protein OE903_04945 [Bacillus sp. B6(2022)]|nr:hypothetical protein [Bacillus sp. B6(2022)]